MQVCAWPETNRYRDQVINGRLHVLDRMYDDFIKAIGGEKNGEEIGTDTATIALTSTATLIGPASVKTILSGVATGIAGVKGTVDKNLFFQKTISVLIAQMDAQRKTVLLQIRTGQNQSTTQYPLSAALVDIDAYYRAGSLESAINALAAAAQSQGTKADDSIKQQLSMKYGPDSNSKLILAYWKPKGVIDTTNQSTLEAKITAIQPPLPDTSITGLLYHSDDATVAARASIIKDLNLK